MMATLQETQAGLAVKMLADAGLDVRVDRVGQTADDPIGKPVIRVLDVVPSAWYVAEGSGHTMTGLHDWQGDVLAWARYTINAHGRRL